MNDRAATARRVGSKDCNLSWSILQEWKKNESEREREREGEGEEERERVWSCVKKL